MATLGIQLSSFAIMQSVCPQSEAEQIHWLSYFALNGSAARDEARNAVESMPGEALRSLLQLANLHHVALPSV